MKSIRIILSCILAVLLGYSIPGNADDIDIYSGNSNSGIPNVLFVMDNGANFSASASAGCNYSAAAGGGAASLGATAGGIEQCALVDAITALPVGTVNIGLMVFNANNFTSGTIPPGVSLCVGADGGCLLKPLTLMDAAGKTALTDFIKTWKTSGANSATEFNIKSAGDATASAMQEAWAYYNGKIGMSGKNYVTPIVSAGCQKNFIIYIGNSFTTSSTPGDGNQDPYGNTYGLGSAYVGASAAQKAKLTDTITFPALTCGVSSIVAGAAASDWSQNWLDEWARYMYQKDTSSSRQGAQNITSYAIGVIDNTHCKPDYPALLTNAARYGGGKYFQTGNAEEVKNAILKILNEVQAVNSVFASSSLPVSVNAQGTYLNQIYMGMFRPEETANPRWVGNLKQYSFVMDSNGQLSLGDALGLGALSSSGLGFLSPNAISYWTCSNASNAYLGTLTAAQSALLSACPLNNDPAAGFWLNFPTLSQSAGGSSDLPDGELVEKGGAAQQIRLANLAVTAATYTSADPAVNGGPRKLYTYCPSGSSCQGALTHVDNAFKDSNSAITAGMFGSSTRYKVTSIARTGTTAVVTTLGNHGFTGTPTITIEQAGDSAYNGDHVISSPSGMTFTISGLADYPTTPNTGAYTAAIHNSSPQIIDSVILTTSTTANANACASGTIPNINCNRVTVNRVGHGYSNGNLINIAGVATSPLMTPNPYSGSFTIGNVTANTFTYDVPVTPSSPSRNAYSAKLSAPAAINITNIAKVSGNFVVTANAHGFANGDTVTIVGNTVATYNATWAVASATANTFQIGASGNPGTGTGGVATLVPPTISIAVGNISRASATATTATATGITSGAFSNGQSVALSYVSGGFTDETVYAPLTGNRIVTITCASPCTSFTFPISTNTGTAVALTTSSPTAALAGSPVTINAGRITRSGTTATVTGVANTFTNGQSIDISVSGAAVGTESAYLSPAAGWTISCAAAGCNPFTFGPVTQTPAVSGAGTQTTAYSASIPPDKTTLINWVRGQDNFGDETGPGAPVTMRPSLHGDVLHSRPMVLNYGGSIGVIVFYGDNGGVFHAVNGNKVNPAGAPASLPPPGNELWGFVPTEMFGKLSRQRINDPDLKLPTTPAGISPPPLKKDYFIDGPTGVYQLFDASGNTLKAILYLTMRRGGNFLYAVDVTNPAVPTVLWRKDAGSTGMAELGQTWSTPKVARVKGRTDPVLIFGAGYDTAQDTEPPTLADSTGRGIYILDAQTGDMVWSATYGAATSCTTTGVITLTTGSRACTNSGMKFSIPSDVALMDKNGDGYVERLYVGDLGGNVWRVDLEPSSVSALADTWQINRLAAIGCWSSDCPVPNNGDTTPRKIFFPPEVISTSTYDAVFVVSGDREHPLYAYVDTQRFNRVFMLQDQHTGNNVLAAPAQALIRPSAMYDATDCSAATVVSPCSSQVSPKVAYAGQSPGYYVTLGPGEKGVNAPTVVAGSVYFGTNLPKPVSAATCTSNLGEARGYRLYPFTAAYGYVVFESEGLPPSPVAGVVQVDMQVLQADGSYITVTKNVPFAIGIGSGHKIPGTDTLLDPSSSSSTGADSRSAFGGQKPPISVSTSRTRTYWYRDGK